MVKPGDPILPYMTSSWFNKTVQASSPQRRTGVAPNGDGLYNNYIWCWVKNSSGSDKQLYMHLALGEPIIELSSAGPTELVFDCTAADEDTVQLAVLLEPIPDDGIGKAVIWGLVPVQVDVGTISLGVPDASGLLQPGADGIVRLLPPGPHVSTPTVVPGLIGFEPAVLDIRAYGDNQLQYTKNGIDWVDWHVGTTCGASS